MPEICSGCKESVLKYQIKNIDGVKIITCPSCTRTTFRPALSYQGITAIFENPDGSQFCVNNKGSKIDINKTPYKNIKQDKWHWKHLQKKKGNW